MDKQKELDKYHSCLQYFHERSYLCWLLCSDKVDHCLVVEELEEGVDLESEKRYVRVHHMPRFIEPRESKPIDKFPIAQILRNFAR